MKNILDNLEHSSTIQWFNNVIYNDALKKHKWRQLLQQFISLWGLINYFRINFCLIESQIYSAKKKVDEPLSWFSVIICHKMWSDHLSHNDRSLILSILLHEIFINLSGFAHKPPAH